MIQRTTWQLFVAVLLFAAYFWLVEPHSTRTDDQRLRQTRVLRMVSERASYLSIEAEDFFIEGARRREGWFLTAPVQARMDAARVRQILNAMEDLPRLDTITPDQRSARDLTLQDYELANPHVRMVVESGGRREELLIGCRSPSHDALYVKLATDNDVLATTTNLLSVLPRTVEELRERRFIYRDPREAYRFEIHRPEGFVQLVRKEGGWRLQQPVAARADRQRVGVLLDALAGLLVEEFVADSAADPVVYRLSVDDAVAQVGLWWKNGEEIGLRLFFGKATEEGGELIYARRGDQETICAVSREILDVLAAKPNDLRDRALFEVAPDDICHLGIQKGEVKLALERVATTSSWSLVEPLQCRADDAAVERILAEITALRAQGFAETLVNPAPYGLNPPACFVTLGGARSEATTGTTSAVEGRAAHAWTRTLSLSAPATDTGASEVVYAALDGDPTVFELGLEALPMVVDATGHRTFLPGDPFYYRDRHVMQIATSAIRRITRAIPGAAAQAAERGADGKWRLVSPDAGDPATAVLEDLLGLMGDLEAARIAAAGPGQEAGYGLDVPVLRLTVGLAGEGGIQKTLLLSAPGPTGEAFAMLQGQDLVFVFERPVVERLRRSLVR